VRQERSDSCLPKEAMALMHFFRNWGPILILSSVRPDAIQAYTLSWSTGQQLTRRVAGVAYFREPKHTNQKQLAGGIAVLSGGKRPTTVNECQQWMDANMAPACKAVRVVPARALGRRA
jgi:hypothetical protein